MVTGSHWGTPNNSKRARVARVPGNVVSCSLFPVTLLCACEDCIWKKKKKKRWSQLHACIMYVCIQFIDGAILLYACQDLTDRSPGTKK